MKKKVCFFFGLCLLSYTLQNLNALETGQPAKHSARRSLSYVMEDAEPTAVPGKQYLFVIGIGNYQHWLPLKNPVRDAQEIRDILKTRYYLDEVFELYDEDATKANILKAFNDLQLKLKTEDSLLIYYAGHGHFDKKTNTGFWIPYDAGLDTFEQNNWLPNPQIRGVITNIQAIHVCLIADSCFAGDILNIMRGNESGDQTMQPGSILPGTETARGTSELSTQPIQNDYFRKSYALISRQVITAGALETVPDASSFSSMLKRVLAKNSKPYIDPFMLFNEIRLGVTGTTPLIGSLKETGHQAGASFLFFLKKEYWPEKASSAEDDIAATDISLPQTITPSPLPEKTLIDTKTSYFSLSLGLGLTLPLGDMSEVMETGINPLYGLSYNLRGDHGELGLGLFGGVGVSATRKDFIYQYYLISVPLALQIKYSFPLYKVLWGIIESNTGLAINFVKYQQAYEKLADLPAAKLYLAPALGVGVRFNTNLSLVVACYYNLIIFDQHIYTNLAPAFRTDIKL